MNPKKIFRETPGPNEKEDERDDAENLIDLDIPVRPLSSRVIKVKFVFEADPDKFTPPDEDDFLIDMD